ncbi:MAG: aminoglycoside phosphotransferase family protein [Firmicutes bacterium]|nr:aminoglycoside phosphotransferase family protein [Bacillota bacterium]
MLAERLLSGIKRYVDGVRFRSALGLRQGVTVGFLAQGEYNLNYLLQSGEQRYVLRVNTGSQMNLDNQIAYEYRALQLLSPTGVTPRAFYLDDTRQEIPYGILVMEYLPGKPLDYRSDLATAARTFARIHGMEFSAGEVEFLVKEPGPLTGIYNEAVRLLDKYFSCPRADPVVAGLLGKIILRAEERKKDEKYLLEEPWLRVINTEVNSHNFIVNPATGSCHLIDWEKPIYGEPAQDLSHFLIATTTLWKQNYILSRGEEELFISTYLQYLPPCPQAKTLRERVEMFKFFNYLRAVSWCAMAWTEYIEPGRPLSNPDTFEKIKAYLEPGFLEGILRQAV